MVSMFRIHALHIVMEYTLHAKLNPRRTSFTTRGKLNLNIEKSLKNRELVALIANQTSNDYLDLQSADKLEN